VALVVDASMVVAWFVIGQATAHTRKVLARAGSEVLHARPLLQIELASALVRLAHRRKIKPAAIGDIFTAFEALDLVSDNDTHGQNDRGDMSALRAVRLRCRLLRARDAARTAIGGEG
jgi:predicted nucleic acid-binding protein